MNNATTTTIKSIAPHTPKFQLTKIEEKNMIKNTRKFDVIRTLKVKFDLSLCLKYSLIFHEAPLNLF